VKQKREHSNLTAVEKQSREFFSGGQFTWKKSEIDIWAAIETQIDATPQGRSLTVKFAFARWAVAASIVLLIGIGSFLRFYSVTIETPAGQHLLVQLPDHSTVNLNAQSTINYLPYWWRFNRSVKFEGEGFFEVQKGKKFTVESSNGSTQVMGTSFNIFSRDEVYKVTCITGSVKVTSKNGNEAILKPNSKAEIQTNGIIKVLTEVETYPEISWKNNIFLFTATPILEVFFEIERQYGVTIETKIDNYSLYSGNFTKNQNVEEVLKYVCPALGLKYERKKAGGYLISEDDE